MANIKVGNKKHGAVGEYVGRPSVLGNPFFMKDESERDHVCNLYEEWFQSVLWTRDVENELQRLMDIHKRDGKLVLVCYCAPKRCHAQTIARELERRLDEETKGKESGGNS